MEVTEKDKKAPPPTNEPKLFEIEISNPFFTGPN